MKSILQEEKACYVCGIQYELEQHHCFNGSNRIRSEKHGLKVWLCHRHHRSEIGVHGRDGGELNLKLKKIAQQKFEETHSREEFMSVIGKNYLDLEEGK